MLKYLLVFWLLFFSASMALAEPFDYPEIKWGVGRQVVKNTESHKLLWEYTGDLMYEAGETPVFFVNKAYDYHEEADTLGQISYHYINKTDMNVVALMEQYFALLETLGQKYGAPAKYKAELDDYSKTDVDAAFLYAYNADTAPDIHGFTAIWRLADMQVWLYCELQEPFRKAGAAPSKLLGQ